MAWPCGLLVKALLGSLGVHETGRSRLKVGGVNGDVFGIVVVAFWMFDV